MHRTIKLPYDCDPAFAPVLADLRRRQSRAIRMAYCQLVRGTAPKSLYRMIRAHPIGQGLHTWLLLSAFTKARALYQLRPEGGIVFGGRKQLLLRSQGKITPSEWRAKRLSPLCIEGHAKSYGSQGGNHLVTLDSAATRLIFHGPGRDYPLALKLSGRSRSYRKRLERLQVRCETFRDTPFSVSLTEKEVCISWNERGLSQQSKSLPSRVLSLDVNPNRIGWSVVERADNCRCQCISWGIFEYPGLNRRLGLASDDARSIAQRNKRHHELAVLAKRIVLLSIHYGVAVVITENLEIRAKNHGHGRGFNRLVNQCWFKKGFLQPLQRRLKEAGLSRTQVNPAYSSLIGNEFWADSMTIPDPACAALELGRRFFHPLNFTPDTRNDPPKSNAARPWKDGRRIPEKSGVLGGWTRVWRNLNPMARDTSRQARRRRRIFSLSGLPRRPSVREQRSRVLHFDPRSGTSDLFGFDFNLLLAG